jgi:Holliday junction resolvase RusA-like endonuclease
VVITSDEFKKAVAELVRHGFSREKAEHEVRSQLGNPRQAPGVLALAPDAVQLVAYVRLPLSLVLPWSALASDNLSRSPVVVNVGPNQRPIMKLVMKAPYRDAKAKARAIARQLIGDVEPVSQPLRLVARVWVPDNRAGHDVSNFAKCTHDAFEKVIYTKDEWLHDVRWIRAGVDVDHPRAEISITPLTEE